MATILLIEPHPLLRLGLRHLLAQAHIAGDLIDIDPLAPIEPDLWLHDAELLVFGLPSDHGSGCALLAEVCARLQPQRVLVLAESPAAALVAAALPECVRGCMHKHSSAAALDAAVRLVLAGGECFPSRVQLESPCAVIDDEVATQGMLADVVPDDDERHVVALPRAHVVPAAGACVRNESALVAHTASSAAPRMAPAVQAGGQETPAAGAHLLNITERQYEVLALLARGYPIKTVSRVLNISVATAKTHACTLYQRLHVRNKGEAVYVALQRGATLNWAGPPPASPSQAPAGFGMAAA
ncbi:LuxR C-terminal-related transcriptional regulator [Cupriavidus pinatubonensis]|uniref:helix-turn-helix transcriptional regulator n=1 Tax=Cupriavidus pinatubonensis TaxID=248026 RepID=UPI001C736BA0|nr:LuxR C-terminal-related transcriptional regulator [Cupriavidus pinatubonensis]QYY27683.1 LuxR C-terminal-related transcriptional regulator [Cupriavidus pinatubonensis]